MYCWSTSHSVQPKRLYILASRARLDVTMKRELGEAEMSHMGRCMTRASTPPSDSSNHKNRHTSPHNIQALNWWRPHWAKTNPTVSGGGRWAHKRSWPIIQPRLVHLYSSYSIHTQSEASVLGVLSVCWKVLYIFSYTCVPEHSTCWSTAETRKKQQLDLPKICRSMWGNKHVTLDGCVGFSCRDQWGYCLQCDELHLIRLFFLLEGSGGGTLPRQPSPCANMMNQWLPSKWQSGACRRLHARLSRMACNKHPGRCLSCALVREIRKSLNIRGNDIMKEPE